MVHSLALTLLRLSWELFLRFNALYVCRFLAFQWHDSTLQSGSRAGGEDWQCRSRQSLRWQRTPFLRFEMFSITMPGKSITVNCTGSKGCKGLLYEKQDH
jgi:hypothetical protein